MKPHPPTSARTLQAAGLCQDYPAGGTYDEMLGEHGEIRAHWQAMLHALQELGRDELGRRQREGLKLLRENGVTYHVYGAPDGMHRPWQLDPVPMAIAGEEWSQIEAGLVERAELLNLILADLYGPRELIRRRLLPLQLIYDHPGFLRPCDQIRLPGRHQLIVYAADLARGPDGRMRVLGDRTQAPSGMGYALENRLAMARVLPSLFRDARLHRLAPFFQALRAGLNAIAPCGSDTPHVVVLTPGPHNETYFEHAYLASTLGYPLVQGDDLTVREGCVWLKSLTGPQRVDVILRRVDDTYCDPLELREDSRLGVPGLLEAVRRGNVAVANPPGSGVLENPGLLAFLPGIARHFLGHPLRLPSAATWWCGQPGELGYVLANLQRLVIKPVYRGVGQQPVFGCQLSRDELEQWRARIRAQPALFVGQEQETCSTVPALATAGLEPRRTVLRSFLVAQRDGYVAMPGGLTRSAPDREVLLVSSQHGSISKDTWVLASQPEQPLSPAAKPGQERPAHGRSGALPGRAADNLFWVGRYAERAEGTARLLRASIKRLYGNADPADSDHQASLHGLLRSLTEVTGTYPGFAGDGAALRLQSPEGELLALALDETRSGSMAHSLRCMVRAGYAVRDLWSSDTWRVMDELEECLLDAQRPGQLTLWQVMDLMDRLITPVSAFSGLVMESMTRGNGWLFLNIGRRLERALLLLALLRGIFVQARPQATETLLINAVLDTTDNVICYRRHYRNHPDLGALLELLVLDENNPRSLAFQAGQLQEYVARLPQAEALPQRLTLPQRLALETATALRLASRDGLLAVDPAGERPQLAQLLERLTQRMRALSDALTAAYFRHQDTPHPLSSSGA